MTDGANPTPSTTPEAGPHAEPGDQEEVYFEGPPPVRAFLGAMVLCIVISLLLLAGSIAFMHKDIGPGWLKIVMILLALLLPTLPVLLAKRIRYRISNYRIDVERGLIARNIDTLELWHVEDMHFHQTIIDRILDVGTITILSRDETLPRVELFGIPNPRPLYEMLKQRVIAVKRQRGVVKMDPG
jgi:hypothetical protein